MKYDLPTILVPYADPDPSGTAMDIFLYLRPETNGTKVESSILRAIRHDPRYNEKIDMVYLANIPGKFILQNHIIEEHYATRLHFAATGGEAFTESMKRRFEAFFQISFDRATVLSAFDALRELDLDMEQLFSLWVEPFDILVLNGQTIKRWKDVFIVNYDIPALLHKNTYTTDIAVMVFRFDLSWDELRKLIRKVTETLVEDGILDPRKPADRVFHYSKGPFEQILDARGYLYDTNCTRIPSDRVDFCRYLLNNGITSGTIDDVISSPIRTFRTEHGLVEENIMSFTMYSSYDEALHKFRTMEIPSGIPES